MIVPLKVLTIGDTHFKTNNVKESLEMCTKLYDLVDTEHIDVILHMGDTLNDHERIHVVPLVNAIKFITTLANKKKERENIMLMGNHDFANNNAFLSEYHPFNGLKGIQNLTIVDKVIVKEFKGMKFVFIPYVHPGRLYEVLATNKDVGDLKSVKVFFGHHEIYGGKMGAVVSTAGDKWPLDNPYFISGHVHDYCRPQDNVVYVGTPMQHAFGDRDDKTVSIWTIYPDQPPIEKRIDLGLTKKMILTLKSSEVVSWKPPAGYMFKLIVEGTNSEIKALMKLDYVKTLVKKGIKIVYNTIDEINIGINKKINFNEVRLSFQERVKIEANKSEDQLYWFNKIFVNNFMN